MIDIIGYEGLYAITSCGKVWSYRNKRFLAPFNNKQGYMKVNLYKNGKEQKMYIHRLVAQAYLPNPNNLPEINHKNECKTDNYVNNLEWCDHKYNLNYGTRTEKVVYANTNGKCSKPVLCVETGIIYPSTMEVQRQLGLANQNISACCRGKIKIVGGYHWQYV